MKFIIQKIICPLLVALPLMANAQCGQCFCSQSSGNTTQNTVTATPWAGAITKQDIADNPQYYNHFTDGQMRIDLIFGGNAAEQKIYLLGLKAEPVWGGTRKNLVPDFEYGEYRMEVIDTQSGKVIYANGFNTLFQEWRTMEEAQHTSKAFKSSCRIPYPKNNIKFVIYERLREKGSYSKLAEFSIDPADKSINRERENNFAVVPILDNGHPQNKVDLVFIAEGYSSSEMDKFRSDVQKHMQYLFDTEPYKHRKSDFNIWAVESVSNNSGTDIPHHDIWKQTVANSNFYTFKTDRYLTASDHTLLCQLSSNTPCDAIYVIVNTEKYGGGGIYNFYGLSMSDHPTTPMVFVHEFGHSFAGLADEYFYDTAESFTDMYNIAIEPWEPNITSLVEFEKKWKDMLVEGTPIPTPVVKGKEQELGVYEGGGYMTKGIYRPVDNCRMRTNNAPCFCPVCQRAIERMIDYYCK